MMHISIQKVWGGTEFRVSLLAALTHDAWHQTPRDLTASVFCARIKGLCHHVSLLFPFKNIIGHNPEIINLMTSQLVKI